MTCGRAREFLARKKIQASEVVDAKKQRFGAREALRLAREANQIHVAKGKKVIHFDLRKRTPSDDELLAVLLGPSGHLRAPTMRSGKTLLVGFEPEAFEKILG